MQISSLIDIIDGRLLNHPSISFIYSFKTDPSKVKEGDLFIAKNLDDIESAVKNGAFAIITENFYPIIDNEIAWIKVNSINKCFISLIRFKLAHFELEAFYCDKVSYDMMNIFASSTPKDIKFITDDLEVFIKELEDIKNDDILISNNIELLDKIYPNNKDFNKQTFKIDNLTEHSLFEVSFTYNDIYFPKLKLASIYIPQFINIYSFLEGNFDISKLKSFNNLKPLFLDKNLEITDFGRSDRFIISQNDENLIKEEIKYLNSKYKYAKTIFITSYYNTSLNDNQIIIKNISELKETLKNNSFNAAYLIGFDFNDINTTLIKLEKQNSLF